MFNGVNRQIEDGKLWRLVQVHSGRRCEWVTVEKETGGVMKQHGWGGEARVNESKAATATRRTRESSCLFCYGAMDGTSDAVSYVTRDTGGRLYCMCVSMNEWSGWMDKRVDGRHVETRARVCIGKQRHPKIINMFSVDPFSSISQSQRVLGPTIPLKFPICMFHFLIFYICITHSHSHSHSFRQTVDVCSFKYNKNKLLLSLSHWRKRTTLPMMLRFQYSMPFHFLRSTNKQPKIVSFERETV